MSAYHKWLVLQHLGESKTKCFKSKTVKNRLKTLCERLNANEMKVDTFKKIYPSSSFNLRKRLYVGTIIRLNIYIFLYIIDIY